jgi:membrane-anchored protein YejM (alkaline phosphatase superfamily)
MLHDYVQQVGFVDRLVGRFLARLDAEGLTDRSIIVLTADHGLPSLEPFAARTVVDGVEINSARPRVPLMIRAPGLTPAVTAADYQHRDFRTLLLALLRGDHGMVAAWSPPGRVAGKKFFCSEDTKGVWYVRDGDARWLVRRPAAPDVWCGMPP